MKIKVNIPMSYVQDLFRAAYDNKDYHDTQFFNLLQHEIDEVRETRPAGNIIDHVIEAIYGDTPCVFHVVDAKGHKIGNLCARSLQRGLELFVEQLFLFKEHGGEFDDYKNVTLLLHYTLFGYYNEQVFEDNFKNIHNICG